MKKRIGYARLYVSIEVSKELPDEIPIMRLGPKNRLWEDNIAVSYHWRPPIKTKNATWQPMGKTFKNGTYQELMQLEEGGPSSENVPPTHAGVLSSLPSQEAVTNIDPPIIEPVNHRDVPSLTQPLALGGTADVPSVMPTMPVSEIPETSLVLPAVSSPLTDSSSQGTSVSSDDVSIPSPGLTVHENSGDSHSTARCKSQWGKACVKGSSFYCGGTKQFIYLQKLKVVKQELKSLKSAQGPTDVSVTQTRLELVRVQSFLSSSPADQHLID
ncbi:hypothetical protein K2173_007601 [Erythroxylum novogranatense]|uniref:Uncharacterized protein n=1 Tax=Erythroxylum novogranatense TaxID=1862640 RepID=A0AAV8S8U0_9ROSI|nr:hypothetical protein K2173_007601 [Erythroxylum novogranatense]